jgi:hypothetical protein
MDTEKDDRLQRPNVLLWYRQEKILELSKEIENGNEIISRTKHY